MKAIGRVGLIAAAVVILGGAVFLLSRTRGNGGEEPVIARLGVEGCDLSPAQSAVKVRFGRSTRTAIHAAGDATFVAKFDEAPSRLVFSIAAKHIAATSRGATFVIDAHQGDRWRRVFAKMVNADTKEWTDFTVPLGGTVAGARELRFVTKYEGPETGKPADLYWGSVLAFGSGAGRKTGGAQLASPPVNVILISLDTLGADHLSSFGNAPQVSPHIDAFMADSFSFRHAYSQYPNTPVSHASLFTGLYPKHHHVYETSPWLKVKDTIAAIMARQGYFTAAITEDAFISSDFGFDTGFDWYDNGREKTTNPDAWGSGNSKETFSNAKAWIKEFGQQAPYFLFVHTYEVHVPYKPKDAVAMKVTESLDPGYKGPFEKFYPGSYYELGHNRGREYLPEKDLKQLVALYSGEIEYLDRVVHNFVRFVASRPDAGRTLVVLTSDHGEEFGEHGKLGHGETLHEEALHVPLAFHWPGHIKKGKTRSVVELVDVMPTILDLLKVPAPGPVDGHSLRPLLEGQPPKMPGRAFAELKTALGECRKLKLPENCNVNRLAVQTAGYKFITSEIPPFEHLYDIKMDPHEMRDIAKVSPNRVVRYRALLEAYKADVEVGQSGQRVPTAGLDQDTIDRLRALGYIQ